MDISVTVRAAFSARHRVDGHTLCGRGDGHSWQVAVTLAGGIDPKTGAVVDHGIFSTAVKDLARTLDHDDLNLMFPGVITTPEGVALQFREQLILAFPMITTITVTMDDISATIHQVRR